MELVQTPSQAAGQSADDTRLYTKALLNILEDVALERERSQDLQRALLNILEDVGDDAHQLESTQRAVLNILDDSAEEKAMLESSQRAFLNILDDFSGEKRRLEDSQRAVLNILEDFEEEKLKVENFNLYLQKEVADRQDAERALLAKGQALTRSNADLEQFAYVASHDLQEPLRMVSSYMQLFSRRFKDQVDPEAARYIEYAVEGAKRMQSLISGLLEYSRVGREEQSQLIDSNKALQLAIANLQSVITESDAKIEFTNLPKVVCDLTQLVQVFQNLIGNAIKFRPANGVPRISVQCAREGSEWKFSVSDNGIGIEKRHSDRIFVIFQRLHTRGDYPGTGLGLSICRKVIDRHGGRIWVESTVDYGSTFYFTLPVSIHG